jgi:hypothetical protein
MRALLVLALLGGCVGAGGARPAVIPKLSELPADPERRNAVLDSANAQPGPEQRKPLPPKLHRAETAAATAAAILGEIFSSTKNVTLGAASVMDENVLFAPSLSPARPKREAAGEGEAREDGSAPAEREDRPANLVPWVRLKPPAE